VRGGVLHPPRGRRSATGRDGVERHGPVACGMAGDRTIVTDDSGVARRSDQQLRFS
jgi:hypothetical protein